MRIWSKRLICYLPDKQLKAMRYELGDMIKQYPNIKHSLVKFANEYDIAYLYGYFDAVCKELRKRNVNMNVPYNNKILDIVYDTPSKLPIINNCAFKEDNDRYLRQCYYNLQEKYDRGIVSKEDWKNIHKNIYGLIKEVD